jgi:spermidine synthase
MPPKLRSRAARPFPVVLLLACYGCSGFAGLVYEVAWKEHLTGYFGGTVFATTTILSIFMGGLGLGSWIGSRIVGRLARPIKAYGYLELAIAVLAPIALPFMSRMPTIVTAGLFVLPAAVLMGLTWPIAVAAGGDGRSRPQLTGYLYGFNTLGAVAGSLAAGFLLLRWLGITRTVYVAAAVSALAGLVALLWPSGSRSSSAAGATGRPLRLELWPYVLSGAAGMAYQVAWTRALVLAIGSSAHAFSLILAAYIFGIAAGSLAIGPRLGRISDPARAAGRIQAAVVLFALLTAPLIGELPGLIERLVIGGFGYGRLLLVQFALVLALLFVPTLGGGMLLPVLCRFARDDAERAATAGRFYMAGSFGAIGGAAVAGFVLIPLPGVGMQGTLWIASAAGALAMTRWWGRRRLRHSALVVAAGVAIALLAGRWNQQVMTSGPYLARPSSEGARVLLYREDTEVTVAVTESDTGQRTLKINGKPDASNGYEDMSTQTLLGTIPLMLRPGARRVCVLGLGSGVTTGAVLAHPVERVDTVEISPAVIEAARLFEDVNAGALDDERSRIHRADAKRFLTEVEQRYDVIISEPSNPWMAGIAQLYTVEMLTAARDALVDGGLHCQWLQGYSMSETDFVAVQATMRHVFPHVQLWETSPADYLLIGSTQPIEIDPVGMYFVFQRPEVGPLLRAVNIREPAHLTYYFAAGDEDVARWTEGVEPLTIDRCRLTWSTPAYVNRSEHRRIVARLAQAEGLPAMVGDAYAGTWFRNSLRSARQARRALAAASEASAASDLQRTLEAYRQLFAVCPDDFRWSFLVQRDFAAARAQAPDLAETFDELIRRVHERIRQRSDAGDAALQGASDLRSAANLLEQSPLDPRLLFRTALLAHEADEAWTALLLLRAWSQWPGDERLLQLLRQRIPDEHYWLLAGGDAKQGQTR